MDMTLDNLGIVLEVLGNELVVLSDDLLFSKIIWEGFGVVSVGDILDLNKNTIFSKRF